MKKLLIILLFPLISFTQTKKQLPDTCFTQQELADMLMSKGHRTALKYDLIT